MKRKMILLCSVAALLAGAVAWGLWGPMKTSRIAYVKLGEVYNDFTLKKELEQKLISVQTTRKTILDSLELQLKMLYTSIENNAKLDEKERLERVQRFEALRGEYQAKQRMFEEDNESTTKRYTDQIWKQLNEYVKSYGQEEGYSYIFGADGSGGLMYANDGDDITGAVQAYVNGRYKGQL